MGDIFVAILPENQHILDTDAEFTGQIDAGFSGANRANRHRLIVGTVGAGCFVDFQTLDTVLC